MSLATQRVTVRPPLDALLGAGTTTRTAAVRDTWAYIRHHNLKRGRYVVLDAKLRPLAAVLRPRQLKNGDPILRNGQCHFLGVASLVARHLESAPASASASASAPASAPDAMSVVPCKPHIL